MRGVDILGLPLHPLIVHAAVVLVPLAALGALLASTWRVVLDRYGGLLAGLAVVAGMSAVAARLSGAAFIESMGGGTPAAQAHQQWGLLAPIPAVVLALTLPVFVWLERRSGTPRWVRPAIAALNVVAAIAALVLVLLSGHSGAVAVWGR